MCVWYHVCVCAFMRLAEGEEDVLALAGKRQTAAGSVLGGGGVVWEGADSSDGTLYLYSD